MCIFCTIDVVQTYASSIILADNAVQIQRNHQIFRKNGSDGETVQGLVSLANGFTIDAEAMATLDTSLTVSGPMDLRETGTLQLLGDLFLDASVTLSGGGKIKAHGNTIFMSGDLTLPPSKVLHFMNNAVVDGRDHNLIVDTNSQIFLDTAVSVTFKNMTIKNKRNGVTVPPVRLAAQTTQLTLDDVIMAPVNDFAFPQGQLFINNDVMFTGTSAFIYQSTQPCRVTPNSCLYFDNNTTFSFAPACNDKNLIVLQDSTSSLYLDGCDLKTTLTGIRLTAGRLICDNKMIFDSQATYSVAGLDTQILKTGEDTVNGISWSPNGKYLAVAEQSGNLVKIFTFDGATINFLCSASYAGVIYSINWSPDGKYIAVGVGSPIGGNELQVFSFDGSALTLKDSKDYGSTDLSVVNSVNWSPDGNYLAVGGSNPADPAKQITVYSFNGSTLSINPIASIVYIGDIKVVNWSHDGRYLAVGGNVPTGNIKIYLFNGSTLTLIPGAVVAYGGVNIVNSINWSPDDRYLAVGVGDTVGQLKVYSFSGIELSATLTEKTGCSISYGTQVKSVSWSPDGQYLSAGGSNGTSDLAIYSFNGSTLSFKDSKNYGNSILSVNWRPDGNYLAVGGDSPSAGHEELEIYPVTFTKEPTPQTMNNAIIFGNKNMGSTYNLQTTFLGGCNIEVNGLLNDDSV